MRRRRVAVHQEHLRVDVQRVPVVLVQLDPHGLQLARDLHRRVVALPRLVVVGAKRRGRRGYEVGVSADEDDGRGPDAAPAVAPRAADREAGAEEGEPKVGLLVGDRRAVGRVEEDQVDALAAAEEQVVGDEVALLAGEVPHAPLASPRNPYLQSQD